MRKLLEDNKLATDNDLDMYYSGGGCYHLSYDTNIENLFWLINDIDETNEPSFDFPTDENQRCIFGLDCSNLEDTAKTEQIIEILENNQIVQYKDQLFFYDFFTTGVKLIKKVTEEINLLTREVS